MTDPLDFLSVRNYLNEWDIPSLKEMNDAEKEQLASLIYDEISGTTRESLMEGMSESGMVIPDEYKHDEYLSLLIRARVVDHKRIMIGIPTTGLIRMEWALARWGQMIPTNWSSSDGIQFMNQVTPLGYNVADARNVIAHLACQDGFDWLLFVDHDVILPPDCFVKLNEYMRDATIPVVCGLYFAKCHPPEPLLYRGRGNSYFKNFNLGDKVWVDGVPMGLTLINGRLLRLMWEDAPTYIAGGNREVKKVFDTPQIQLVDPDTAKYQTMQGTEDLAWCNRVIHGEYLKRAGFHKVAGRRFPFLADTSIFGWHMDPDGRKYPLEFTW